jgi:hypothetical protein
VEEGVEGEVDSVMRVAEVEVEEVEVRYFLK